VVGGEKKKGDMNWGEFSQRHKKSGKMRTSESKEKRERCITVFQGKGWGKKEKGRRHLEKGGVHGRSQLMKKGWGGELRGGGGTGSK